MKNEELANDFLFVHGWGNAQRSRIAADFSSRVFERVVAREPKKQTAILMHDGDPHKVEDFVHISSLLRRLKIAAPEIYASDIRLGFVLMEDFGDRPAGRALDAGAFRDEIDDHAARTLAKLHTGFAEPMLGAFRVPLYNATLFAEQAGCFLDYYFPYVFKRQASARERSAFFEAWHGLLSPLDTALPRSLVLRDYMPENMMLLEEPVFGEKAGIIDFQDAGIGSVAYDIASWCEEVRRDGGLSRLEGFISLYCNYNPALSPEKILPAARIYAAQRHVRILGRLVKLDKTAYIPRVWRALQGLLKDPSLAPMRGWFSQCSTGL